MLEQNNEIENILGRILKIEGENRYHSFINTDGKRWIMPVHNMAIAMELYQPSGIKGKRLKRFLPHLHWCRFVRERLDIVMHSYVLAGGLKQRLCELFQVYDIEFAIFCGTPSVHQKITIQLSRGSRILGYCKVTDKEDIKQIFRKEQVLLGELSVLGVENIPRCLACEPLFGSIGIFVQSTIKSCRSKTVHQWSKKHWDFLRLLHQRTQRLQPFEQTDFYYMLSKLISQIDTLPDSSVTIIRQAINGINKEYSGTNVLFSAFHGDFTPWNMFVEQGRLFVFDFEYAQLTYPPFLDWFHFFMQTMLFEKHMEINNIMRRYSEQKQSLSVYFVNPDLAFQSYLLSVIGTYIARSNGMCDEQTRDMVLRWTEMLLLVQYESQ